MSDSTAHLKMIQMKSTSTSHQHSHSRCTIVFCINILTPCFFRAGHVTCSDLTTLDGGALRHAPLRLPDLESVCSGRSYQSDWLYQVRPGFSNPTRVVEQSKFTVSLAFTSETVLGPGFYPKSTSLICAIGAFRFAILFTKLETKLKCFKSMLISLTSLIHLC